MSLNPRHTGGRPILDRKQTLAPISTRHNRFSVPIRWLFQSVRNNLDTGTSIYYNIHDPRPDLDDNLYRNASITSRNVINFDDYRARTSSDRMSARNSGSHPSTLRPTRSRRLGSSDRMARIKLSARRSVTDRLQRTLSACIAFTLGPLLPDRFGSEQMERSVSEYRSRSESLRRIRQTTLDSLNNYGGWR
jgi:hypothetical protein